MSLTELRAQFWQDAEAIKNQAPGSEEYKRLAASLKATRQVIQAIERDIRMMP